MVNSEVRTGSLPGDCQGASGTGAGSDSILDPLAGCSEGRLLMFNNLQLNHNHKLLQWCFISSYELMGQYMLTYFTLLFSFYSVFEYPTNLSSKSNNFYSSIILVMKNINQF